MAIDWNRLLSTVNTGLTTVNQLTQNPALRTVAGLGLTGAGLLQKEEPGYATEAVQYLRNRLAPQGIAQQFSGQIGALNQEYLPYLEQQRNQLLNQAQQRFIAGQPSSFSTAMSGPEIAAIRNAITTQILPAERAHVADIGQFLLGQGGSAAGTLLGYAKPDPLGEYLATIGMNLLGGQRGQPGAFGAAGNALSGNVESALQMLGQLAMQPGGIGQALSQNPQLVAQLGAALGAQLGFDASMAGGGLSGWTAMTSRGVAIPIEAISTGGAGAVGGIASALGLAGAGAGGYFLGGALGGRAGARQDSQLLGAGTGALSGAAAGAAIGSMIIPGPGTAIGVVVGGLAGLFGGFGATREAQHAEKAYNLSQDLDSQKDQVLELGNIGMQFGQQLGIPSQVLQSFMAQAQQLAETSASPADEQTMVAQALGALLRQYIPADQWAVMAPQLRQQFIDYMTRSTFTAGNSIYGGGPPLSSFPQWAGAIGLAQGGYARQPLNAMVGERGPELAHLSPGSYIIPIHPSMN